MKRMTLGQIVSRVAQGSFKIMNEDGDPRPTNAVIKSDAEKEAEKKKKGLYQMKAPMNVLIHNFNQIFPRSGWQQLKIFNLEIDGNVETDLIINITAEVKSSVADHNYIDHITLRRPDKSTKWNLNMKGEVKCTCKAFHYWMAYPDLQSKNLYGNPRKWNRVANKVKNPEHLPGLCKHLVKLIYFLHMRGILLRNDGRNEN